MQPQTSNGGCFYCGGREGPPSPVNSNGYYPVLLCGACAYRLARGRKLAERAASRFTDWPGVLHTDAMRRAEMNPPPPGDE